jgi:hypothetical protein
MNILKVRDDPQPVVLERCSDASPPKFIVSENSACIWAKEGEEFGPEKLRPRIEPWLTTLCQSEHLSLLLGSGLSTGVQQLATQESKSVLRSGNFGTFGALIEAAANRSALATGRAQRNIEDEIRVANELMRGFEIIGSQDDQARTNAGNLRTSLTQVLRDFATSILDGEHSLVTADERQRENAFNYLVSFLMSFASRTGTRDRLQVFTTNYDRFIEAGAEAAGLHLLDRFVGSVAPVFRSSRLDLDIHYNPPGIRGEPRYLEGVARFTKLHGSVDWLDCEGGIRRVGIPFGANEFAPFLKGPGMSDSDAMKLMIYPNAAKDRETAAYPYVELFRDLAAAVCRPNHTLVSFGCGFGDEHINRVIEDMLTIPSTHLVIIAYDDPFGRIMKLYEQLGRYAQISLLIGDHVGAFKTVVDHYLPKPAIDRTTFRMAELLKARWGANQGQAESLGHGAPDSEKGEE